MYLTTWLVFQNQGTYICRQSYTTVPERYLTRCVHQCTCSNKLVCFTSDMLESWISFGKVSEGKDSSVGTSVLHRSIAYSFPAVVGHLCDFECSKVCHLSLFILSLS